MSWRDLWVLVTCAQPDTATFKALNPEWQHTPELELLRSVEFSTRWLQWSRTEAAAKRQKSPEPYPLPWDEKPEADVYKGDAVPIDELNKFLGWSPELIAQWKDGS